jgi:Short C-terminal domain
VNLSDDPEAAKEVMGSVERATGMDLDGDGSIGGSVPPPAPGTPAPPPTAAPSDDTVSRLERLAALHAQGVLTDDEFAQQKAKLLGS